MARGIIPARAGFTRSLSARTCGSGDHPRSRGVYAVTSADITRSPGSSPLARGLPDLVVPEMPLDRIIPARAGFTKTRQTWTVRSRDHPRSRGVYFGRAEIDVATAGSSPLARGLQSKRCASHFAGRIIPARAGFTVGSQAGTGRNGDHPRSRGVYWPAALDAAGVIGSSPLARGLLRHKRCPQHATPDHPRSRGVYGTTR